MQILEGIKAVDISQFVAGSRCTQILADMGAEVVKVEPPHGDTLRMIFKMTPGAERNYSVFNRNKYGIAVNEDENLKKRGMFQRVSREKFGDIDISGFPFKFSDTSGTIRMPAPALGEHSRLILEQWLGFTSEEIQYLYKKGTIV